MPARHPLVAIAAKKTIACSAAVLSKSTRSKDKRKRKQVRANSQRRFATHRWSSFDLRSNLLVTAPRTTFKIPVPLKAVPLAPRKGTVSTISRKSRSLAISARSSSSSFKCLVASGSLPTWKNCTPSCHAGASSLSSFFAA